MKTKKKFFDLQFGRGKDAPWCEKEWNRRRTGTTEWKTGQCRDTKPPTVQAYASSEKEEGIKGVSSILPIVFTTSLHQLGSFCC